MTVAGVPGSTPLVRAAGYPKRSRDELLLAIGALTDAVLGGIDWLIFLSIPSFPSADGSRRNVWLERRRSD